MSKSHNTQNVPWKWIAVGGVVVAVAVGWFFLLVTTIIITVLVTRKAKAQLHELSPERDT